MKMGSESSKNLPQNAAYQVFTSAEQELINILFNRICQSKDLKRGFSYQQLQNYLGSRMRVNVCEHLYKYMLSCADKSASHVDKEDFITCLSHMLKGIPDEKCQFLCHLSSGSRNSTSVKLLKEILEELISQYVNILNHHDHSSVNSWKFNSEHSDFNSFIKGCMLTFVSKSDGTNGDRVIGVDELTRWMSNNALLIQIMDSVFQNCFPVASPLETRESIASYFPYCEKVPWAKFRTQLDIPSLLYINSHIPSNFNYKWRLLFSSHVHGENFSLLVKHIVDQGPSVMIIKDTDGHVFGGFASIKWVVRPQFVGTNECFLFTLSPYVAVYSSTTYNTNFMYLNQNQETMPNGLGMGGQLNYFGLWISQEFGKGHSKAKPKCTSFNSPQLSKSEEFSIASIEVWGIGPSPEELKLQIEDPDAPVSILDKDPAAKAMLALVGKGPVSEGIRDTDAQASSPAEDNLPPI